MKNSGQSTGIENTTRKKVVHKNTKRMRPVSQKVSNTSISSSNSSSSSGG